MALFVFVLQSQQPVSVHVAGQAITLEQVREWMFTPSLNTIRAQQVHRQLRAQSPPWFPETVLDEIDARIEGSDMAPTAYPFYKACLSWVEADVIIHLAQTNVGSDVLSTSLVEQDRARQAGLSREATVETASGKVSSKISALTEQQRKELLATLSPVQKRALADFSGPKTTACLRQASASSAAALNTLQSGIVQQVITFHRPLLEDARMRYEAQGKQR